MMRYKIEATIETYIDHKAMIEWLEKLGFHTIKCTEDDE